MITETYTQAAEGVLGAMLIDRQAAAEILSAMCPEDFLLDDHRAIYTAADGLFSEGAAITPVTIAARTAPEFLTLCRQLAELTPSAAVWPSYARIVREAAAIEHARPAADQLALDMAHGAPLEQVRRQAETLAGALGGSDRQKNIFTLTDLCTEFMSSLGQKVMYLDWGFDKLNRHVLCKGGEYVILGARPSVGKTAFALQVSLHMAAKQQKRVGFFSLETDRKSVLGRIMTAQSYVPLSAIKRGTITPNQTVDLAATSRMLSTVPMEVVEAAGYTPEQIRRDTLVHRLDVVIVDYLQLVCNVNPRLTEYDRISETSRALQLLAKELRVTVIALSQLSRNTDAYTEPDSADLRGSGQIEQDADAILLMYIPPASELRTPEEKAEQETLRRIKISKNKEGLTGKLKFWFNGKIQRFAAEWPDFYAKKSKPEEKPAHLQETQVKMEEISQ